MCMRRELPSKFLWCRKQVLDDLQEEIGHCKSNEQALDGTLWSAGSGRGCGHVIKQTGNDQTYWNVRFPNVREWETVYFSCTLYRAEVSGLRGLRRVSAATRLLGSEFESHRVHGCLSVVSVVCCQRSPRRADHSSRGVLPTVVCLSVIVKPG